MAAFSPVFSCFFAKNTPRGRARERQKIRRGMPPAHGVVSVNPLFSKILVTGVKQKIDLPLGPQICLRRK
jgi:hypothetical protein